MRKILKWDTTFINRENTNIKIYEEVNKLIQEEHAQEKQNNPKKKNKKRKQIETFAEAYNKMRIKRIEKTINSTESIHTITYDEQLKARVQINRTQGRPKFKWAEKGINEYWEMIRTTFKYSPMKAYDQEDDNQREFMQTYASAAIQTPKETWSLIENTEPRWNKDKTRDDTHPHTPRQRIEETKLYTDGSCPTNSKVNEENCPAGWGIAIYEEERENITIGLFGPVETKTQRTEFSRSRIWK